jgi:hypothetical protein
MTENHHTEDRLLSRIHFVVEALHVVLTVLTFHSLTIPYVFIGE